METIFKEKFDTFYAGVQKIYLDYMQHTFPALKPETFEWAEGPRYIKIWRTGSIHAFVDTVTGDVLKPAGVHKPAKHARGNIFDEHNGLLHMTPNGPAYLK